MTEPRAYWDALWSAWSWMRFVRHYCKLRIVVDGPVNREQQCVFERLFPGGQILPARAVLEDMRGWSLPSQNFFRQDVFGRKVAAIFHACSQADTLYNDADVLVFRKPDEILNNMKTSRNVRYLEDKMTLCYDPELLKHAEELGCGQVQNINSGVMYLPCGILNVGFAEKLLNKRDASPRHRFIEQSLFSVLLNGVAERESLSREYYTLTNQGAWIWEKDIDYSHIKMRHFMGQVRHQMYLSGMPLLKRLVETDWEETQKVGPNRL